MRLPRCAVLLCLVSSVAVAQERQQPPPPGEAFSGTWKDARLTLTLTANAGAAGQGRYDGAVRLGAKTFPLIAARNGKGLTGNFTDGPNTFLFTAAFDGEVLAFKSGSTTYRLTRAAAAANPLENPDAPMTEPPPAGPDPKQVEQAVAAAKAYLYAVQANGNWDLPQRVGGGRPDVGDKITLTHIQNSSQWGGLTALCTYALLAAGDAPAEPKLAAAIKFLKEAEIEGTYALGTRALVWAAMPNAHRKESLDLAKKDSDLILKNQRTDARSRPFFRYLADTAGDTGSDHSASQFAVLGLWAAEQCGAEIPTAWWKEQDAGWRRHQFDDGGWSYSNTFARPMPATASMTAAGVATLLLCQDRINPPVAECNGNRRNDAVDRGIAWLLRQPESVGALGGRHPYYTLYGIERIGLAGGHKYFGNVDWYKQGATNLIASQNRDGSWGAGGEAVSDTCFALLFLVRGRAPLVMNKLEYVLDRAGDTPKPANWNQRPRDVANLARWMTRQLEREVNWQIVNLKAPAEELLDAPILFVSGNHPLSFSKQEEEKLQRFVQQGGLIVGHADCSDPKFAVSFAKLGSKLFPAYEFRDLPSGHLIYENLFSRARWKNPPRVQGLSNGVRELMLLIPSGDPARYWQTNAYGGHEGAFELMANVFLYANERRDLRNKGESWVVTPRSATPPGRTIKVARLMHAHNPDPEPGGWRRMGAILANEHQLGLAAEPVKLGDGKLGQGGYKIAHLTGTGKVKLRDEERAELKGFVDAGGTLLVDAAGGDAEAAAGLEAEVTAIGGGAKPQVLPVEHSLYATLGVPADQIGYRTFAKRTLSNAKGPRLRAVLVNGRAAVLFSPEDLSVGLVGHPVDGVHGYTPASATALVKAVVVQAGLAD
jgi:hypothetical protein